MDLIERATKLQKELSKALSPLTRLERGLKALGKTRGQGPALGDLMGARKAVAGAELGGLGLEESRRELDAELGEAITALRTQLRGRLVAELARAAEREEIGFDRVGDRPPTVLLAPLVCELDLDEGEARLMYGREVVTTCDLAVEPILEAREETLAAIGEGAPDPDTFFAALRAAYDTARAARRLGPGERVPIVELLAPLALHLAGPGVWTKKGIEKVEPVPRYRLAYLLRQLQRTGGLERRGHRLELGAATGGSTRDKKTVLYVPSSPADGQYYLSLRFVPAHGGPP